MGEIINQVAKFFDDLVGKISGGTFASTSTAIVMGLFWLAALTGLIWQFVEFARADKDGGPTTLVVQFFKAKYRILIVWVLVAGMPAITASLSSSIKSTLGGLNSSVAGAGAGVLDTMGKNVTLIWYTQGELQAQLAAAYPALLDGMQDKNDTAADAGKVSDTLARLKTETQAAIQRQIQEGQTLLKSKNPVDQKRGQKMVDDGEVAQKNLGKATTTAKTKADGTKQAADSQWSSWENVLAEGLRSLTSGATLGMTDLVLLVKRLAAGVIGFIMIAPALLLAVMTCWKLIQSIVSLFTQLSLYVCIVALACAFSSVLGPLAMVTFLFTGEESRHWRKYGDNFISFWLQALAGSVVLGVAVKTLVVPAISSLGGFIANAGASFYNNIIAAPSLGDALLTSVLAGLCFMSLGFAMDFLSSFLQKAPQAGIGAISGTFHP